MLELMTQAQYARHRGVTRQAVSKDIAAGKIQLKTAPDGRRGIDPAEADFALGASRVRINEPAQQGGFVDPPPANDFGGVSSGLTKARTASEVYRAKLAELEFNEKVGRLLPIEDVTQAMARAAEVVVRELEQMAAFADDFAAAFTRGGVVALRAEIKAKVRGVRVALAESLAVSRRSDDEEGN